MIPKTALFASLVIPFVCLADDGYGSVGSQHTPSSYKVPADIVENFGLKPSAPTAVKITLRGEGQQPVTVTAPVPELAPYAATEVTLKVDPKLVEGKSLQLETTVGEPNPASVIKTTL